MPLSKKVLEDSLRLARLRKIKMTLYAVQVGILVALAFFLIFIIGGAEIKPRLYIPLDSFVAIMVLILLVICVEYFFFRIMEIKFARSSSAKHLMAKNSIERGIIVAIIASVATCVLMVPPVVGAIEDASSKTYSISADAHLAFWSRDPFALTRIAELEVSAPNPVEVYLVYDSVYEEFGGSLSEMDFLKLNKDTYLVDGRVTIEVPLANHELFHLVVNDRDSPGTLVTAVTQKDLSETFTGVVALLALAFVVANVAWVAYLLPIEHKYSQSSIYK